MDVWMIGSFFFPFFSLNWNKETEIKMNTIWKMKGKFLSVFFNTFLTH